MVTTIAGPQAVSSQTLASKAGIDNANIGDKRYFQIHPNVVISIPQPRVTAKVLRPFNVELTPKEGGYMATSDISNAFELGATAGRALKNYLEFLVDELFWLQENAEQLSSSVQDDFHRLRRHMRIV